MLVRKLILLYILVFAFILNAQSNGNTPQGTHQVSEVNLTITSDRQAIRIGEPINIYFNFTNIEKDTNAYANGVSLKAALSDSLTAPKRLLRVENNGSKNNDPIDGEIEIYSNFDNHHSGKGDYATISSEGILVIYFPKLGPGEVISVKYKTIRAEKIGLNQEKICKIDEYRWDFERPESHPTFIPQITGDNNDEFHIDIFPKYNITKWDASNCTLFEHSEIHFYNLHNSSNENISYLDKASQNLIKNGSKLSGLGSHQFAMIINGSNIYSINNYTHFNVIDLIKYHEDLYLYVVIISFCIVILLLLIYRIFIESKIFLHYKRYTKIIIFIYLIFSVLGLIYHYKYLTGYYANLILLESAMIPIAFFLYILYLLYNSESPILTLKYFSMVALGWIVVVTIFHYYLPWILPYKDISNVILGVFILILILINKFIYKILRNELIDNDKSNIAQESSDKNRGIIIIITLLAYLILLFACIMFLIKPTFEFKSKFESLDLLTIGFLEVFLLISMLAVVLDLALFNKILEFIVSKFFKPSGP